MVAKLNLSTKNLPAAFWKRVLAYVIDMLIINLIIISPFEGFFRKFEKTSALFFKTQVNKNFLMITLVIVLLTLAYFVLLEYLTKQTIGKMVLNIYVGSIIKELSLQQVVLRNITKPFSIVLLIDIIYMFFKKTNQRLFEVFSGTIVVEKRLIAK